MSVVVRPAATADAPAIAGIYNYYVTDTIVTFEEEPVSAQEMTARLDEVVAASLPWIVAQQNDIIVGYAYASRWKGRCGYRLSTEVTVYIDRDHTGGGIGSLLYGELFPLLADRGLHVAIGGIALPNPASIALHEKFGMTKVAHFSQVGLKFDQWIDVGYWQRFL